MPSPANIISLAAIRETLAAHFPEAIPLPVRHWATGWAEIDALEGGVPHNAVTELCGPAACGGFFLHQVLASLQERRELAALVDGGHSFDPGSHDAGAFSRLLTVFCKTAEQSVKVTDLLLRDGNLPLVLLDLQMVPLRGLGRIPSSTWHRFQRLVERSGTALVVMTPQPIVEAARLRITLRAGWSLAALKRPRRELFEHIQAQVYRRGKQVTPMEELHSRIA
ncbi:MAG: hypothetical protein ABJF10_11865 [Chthoniobacter sp.]|uniref:hypothetical protein n=1 Tax=Chthoniobacter sp. TaxID=2510640 RepID=UPI0032AD2FB9